MSGNQEVKNVNSNENILTNGINDYREKIANVFKKCMNSEYFYPSIASLTVGLTVGIIVFETSVSTLMKGFAVLNLIIFLFQTVYKYAYKK